MKALGYCLGLSLITFAVNVFAVTTVSVDSVFVAPGRTVQIPVMLSTDTNVTSLQFDMVYATNHLAIGDIVAGAAVIDPLEIVSSTEISPGVCRVVVASFLKVPVTNGVLAYIPFTVAANAPREAESLQLTNMAFLTPQATRAAVCAVSGAVSIVAPPRFNTVNKTNSAPRGLPPPNTAGIWIAAAGR